ncbi:MAG: hypothetical protein NC133_02605 [Prevotella sp.]|nr:hypothetical protein [Prevotella sp.]
MDTNFIKVAYIALRQDDGSMLVNVPLFVRVDTLNQNGMTESQEKLINRIAEIMHQHYERRLTEYYRTLRNNHDKDNS